MRKPDSSRYSGVIDVFSLGFSQKRREVLVKQIARHLFYARVSQGGPCLVFTIIKNHRSPRRRFRELLISSLTNLATSINFLIAMARKKSVNLTDAELRLMEIVWQRGASTVADVAETVPQLAYSTVLTTLRILEEKGYLTHTKEGRAFVYAPVVDRTEASRSAVRHLVNRFFGNRADLLVMNMIEDEAISVDELDRLKKLISEEKES